MNIPGILLTILSALLFAISPVLVSWTYGWGNNPLTMVMFRNLFVLPVLLILMKKDHTAIRLPREQFFQLLFIAAMGSCLTPLLLYSSSSYIGVGAGTTLHFFYPIFVALFCRFFYHETACLYFLRSFLRFPAYRKHPNPAIKPYNKRSAGFAPSPIS